MNDADSNQPSKPVPPQNGTQLLLWRRERRYSQHRVAYAIGTSQALISIWEHTNDALPHEAVERLAKLHVDAGYVATELLPMRKRGRSGKHNPFSISPTDDNMAACNFYPDALPMAYGIVHLETVAEYKKRKGL